MCWSADAEAANGWLYEQTGKTYTMDANQIGKYERGENHWPHQHYRQALCALLGAIHPAELGLYPNRTTSSTTVESIGPGWDMVSIPASDDAVAAVSSDDSAHASFPSGIQAISRFRRALVVCGAPESTGTVPDLAVTTARTLAAHEAYQQAEYLTAATMLPEILAAADHWVIHSRDGAERHQAQRVSAMANVAASKLAAKLGDGPLAWIAADRARSAALGADAPTLTDLAIFQSTCALLRMPGHLADATDTVEARLAEYDPSRTSTALQASTRGALLLLAALVAARQGNSGQARRRITAAAELAQRLGGDDNQLWTGFGPTNVLIHQVSAAVILDRAHQAIELGQRIDTSTMPAALTGRRAQVHVDLAAAFVGTPDGDPPAVLHLLEAERIAPQTVRFGHESRSLLTCLLGRERRATTPGLRPLAARAGMLT